MTADPSQPTDAPVLATTVTPDGHDRFLAAARRNQWSLLGLAVVVLAASFILECGDDRVQVPLAGTPLPGICFFRNTVGIDCPGCGLSRCFISVAHGDLSAAIRYHPWGLVLFVLAVAQIPYRSFQLRRIARGLEPWSHPWLAYSIWILLGGMLVQWLVRMVISPPF